MALRRRVGPGRRGEFFPFVPTAAAPTAPARPPDWLQRRRPVPRRVARGEFFPLAAQTVPAPARITARRRPQAGTRRGELWSLPLAIAPAGLGPWIPRPLSRRRIPAQARRGEFFVVPLAGLAPQGPPPVIPPLLTHRSARVLPRRGEFLPPVPAPSYCAAPLPRRPRPTPRGRRGRMWTAPPVPLVPAGPGPWLPRTLRSATRSSPRRAPRSRFWPMALESVCDPVTHRPNDGITPHASAGSTPQPTGGITARPRSCQ